MIYTYNEKKGGVFCDKYKIAPWPGFSCRRTAIMDCVESVPIAKGKFIEIGFGTGIITYEFFLKGFQCTGYDLEQRPVEIANDIFNREKKIIDFRNKLYESDRGSYDCVGVFEVMEHIEDDVAILQQWKDLIKGGGYIVMSVPARMKYWGYMDMRMGHIRRYEKEQLSLLLSNQGFKVRKLISAGFPYSNIARPFKNLFIQRPEYIKYKSNTATDLTKKSGVDRTQEYKFKNFVPFWANPILWSIQRQFYQYDMGEYYVVVAQKTDDNTNSFRQGVHNEF